MDSLSHLWFTTTSLSYRFPILKLPLLPFALLLVLYCFRSEKSRCQQCRPLPSREVRKRQLQSLRLDGTPDSLKLRLELSTRLSVAERKWRARLDWILQQGRVTHWLFDFHTYMEAIRQSSRLNLIKLTWLASPTAVCGMGDLSVISQHSSLMSLRRQSWVVLTFREACK